ncbi:hypothetical protein CVT24_010504 [Panaeolus cyanescens]|uniref:Uncharacterized protein n=1 Tax=Panaeolus cyanescens TaxID=181874 RepID=A0A409YLS1_9AGAR|nr:hypothetical protein CVT24_010504 [Panaeolus cyanescens]
MQEFGRRHENHQRVPWPAGMEDSPVHLPSPVLALLGSNTLPLPGEESATKTFQASLSHHIEQNEREQKIVEEEISRLAAKLRNLKAARSPLEKQAFACGVVLSPFRRLPDDVLYNIAQQFCFDSGLPTIDSPHRALILGRVSRTFRQIVRNTSAFWKKMRISCSADISIEGCDRQAVEQIAHFATLSGSLALSIHLQEASDEYMETYAGDPHGISHALRWMLDDSNTVSRDVLSRLKQLGITSRRNVSLLRLLMARLVEQGRTLALSSLVIARPHGELDWLCMAAREVARVFLFMPLLKKVWFDPRLELVSDVVTRSDRAPWAQLTVARLGIFVRDDEWRFILTLCPNLEAAWFSVLDDPEGHAINHTASDVFTHHRLKKLVIQFSMGYPADHISVFMGLRFPLLIDLKLQFCSDLKAPGRFGIVARQLQGVFPALQNLFLLNTCSILKKFKYIFPLLMGFSTTTNLSLTMSHIDVPEFAEFLRRRGQDDTLMLPNLRSLHLKFLPKYRRWVKNNEKDLTALLKGIPEARKAAYAARARDAQLTSTSRHNQNTEFDYSIAFSWSPDDHIRHQTPHLEASRKYFTELQRKFQREGTGIPVYIMQEEIPESEDDYLKEDFLKLF